MTINLHALSFSKNFFEQGSVKSFYLAKASPARLQPIVYGIGATLTDIASRVSAIVEGTFKGLVHLVGCPFNENLSLMYAMRFLIEDAAAGVGQLFASTILSPFVALNNGLMYSNGAAEVTVDAIECGVTNLDTDEL